MPASTLNLWGQGPLCEEYPIFQFTFVLTMSFVIREELKKVN